MGLKLLFVCTGNTCRSPMAEGLARELFGEEVQVSSAGIEAWEGEEASAYAQQVFQEKSLDLSRHRSKRISVELLADADWIIPMTQAQAKSLGHRFPQFIQKTRFLGDWGEYKREIQDPWRGSLDTYRQTAREIDELLRVLKDHLL